MKRAQPSKPTECKEDGPDNERVTTIYKLIIFEASHLSRRIKASASPSLIWPQSFGTIENPYDHLHILKE